MSLTPFSIIAILSARRAVDSRCVINMVVFIRSPFSEREIWSIVSNILCCACASKDDVCMVDSMRDPTMHKATTHWFVEYEQVYMRLDGLDKSPRYCDSLPLNHRRVSNTHPLSSANVVPLHQITRDDGYPLNSCSRDTRPSRTQVPRGSSAAHAAAILQSRPPLPDAAQFRLRRASPAGRPILARRSLAACNYTWRTPGTRRKGGCGNPGRGTS